MQCGVIDKFFKTFNIILENDKLPTDYGDGEPLYNSEINFINAIYLNPNSNVKDLSNILNITKSAVTQYGNKLETKGILNRYLKEGNKKEKYFQLSKKGENIRLKHIQLHNKANTEICNYLLTLKENDRKVILDFLEKISNLPISKFDCGSNCFSENS